MWLDFFSLIVKCFVEGRTINKSANDNDRVVIRMKCGTKNSLRVSDILQSDFWLQGTTLIHLISPIEAHSSSCLITRNNLVYSHDFEWAKLHCVVLDSKCSFHFDTRLLYSHLKCFVIPNCYKLFKKEERNKRER